MLTAGLLERPLDSQLAASTQSGTAVEHGVIRVKWVSGNMHIARGEPRIRCHQRVPEIANSF